MAINHTMKFRVSKGQLEQIRFNAKVKGYNACSEYVRDIILKDDFLERKIIEISKDLKEILKRLPDGRS